MYGYSGAYLVKLEYGRSRMWRVCSFVSGDIRVLIFIPFDRVLVSNMKVDAKIRYIPLANSRK